ncbi:DNA repair protein RecO [Spiroplasma alleghenense]|uniref:DNA repair protein RecO n=1 Tax=Spiroplasma alleghenense TaxID=216931 RepID=A0A345Z3C6_9MOLU|nr:DNA repair protein RecO [Spiroplasma alleghenense]AXK51105.1 DNA repair protein recO [Spiroplasma alleghenense]
MPAIEIEAIVLRKYPLNDFDQIIVVFSKEYGKLSIKALGVNRANSKNKFSIQTFSRSRFEIFKTNRLEGISKLKTGELINLNINLSKIYQNYLYASACVELIELSFESNVKNIQAFNILNEVIFKLNHNINSTKNFSLFLFYSLDWFGVKWDLKKCVNCNEKKVDYSNFDFQNYGFLCRKCNNLDNFQVSQSFVDFLIKLDRSNFFQIRDEDQYNVRDVILLTNVLMEYLSSEVGLYIIALETIKKQKVFQNITFL